MWEKILAVFLVAVFLFSAYIAYSFLEQKPEKKYELKVFGTEYTFGQDAKIWLQLLDENKGAINNATCYIDVYYPNSTLFLHSILLNHLSPDGIYYHDLVAPDIEGVFMESASCYVPERAFGDDFSDYSKLENYTNVTISDGKIKLTNTFSILLSPYAWYHLNETSGTAVSDSSGNGRNGTTANNPTWIAGKLNNSLKFNSTKNQYVDLGDNANFERNQNFSVETWFKTNTNTPASILVSRTQCPTNCRGWEVYMDSSKIYFDLINTWSSNVIRISVPATYANGNWHHLIITYDGSSSANGINVYFDGSLLTKTIVYNTLTATIQNTGNFEISGRGKTEYFFNGTEDEVVVYNKTLNATEVAFRYNNGTGTESMPTMGSNAISGFIQSKTISLNGSVWGNFSSDYNQNSGNITFKILNSTNNVICTGLGDISSCADATSPIKLYAELTRPTSSSTSPDISLWWIEWETGTFEEIKGSSEIHISSPSGDNELNILS